MTNIVNEWDLNPIKLKQFLYRPEQTLGVPEDWDYQISWHSHMQVVSLSALYTGRIYPPSPQEILLVLFCWRLSRPHGHGLARRITSMKNSSDIFGTSILYARVFGQLLIKGHYGLVTKSKVVTWISYMHGLFGTYRVILNISRNGPVALT